ncbi:hypothetical protein [Exiguobacterium aurantiacum]|uniref:hypothetical protein n=1 Tax=Exiguobacterium aurantiacum TaxID=33987 RepID=UPI00384F80EE
MKKIKTFETAENKYSLKFGINQLVAIEQELGSLAALEQEMKFGNIVTIFHQGLRGFDRKVTADQAGEIMDEILEEMTFEQFIEELMEAFNGNFQ